MSSLVYLAGAPWDGFDGTDRRLATALAEYRRVLFVDPPDSVLRGASELTTRLWKVDRVEPSVERLRTATPPGMTRPVLRDIADRLTSRAVRQAQGTHEVEVVVLANPLLTFPHRTAGQRVYYITDDWVAGAALMGLSASHVARLEQRNARAADLVVAVSPWLADAVSARTNVPVRILPNGCTLPGLPVEPTWTAGDRPVVGLVGQLNERLDLALLEAVAGRDVDVLVVGPRRERDPEITRRLDSLLSRDNVRWVDAQPAAAVPGYLAAVRVGLTPYRRDDFNFASFPLKTLEYLAAGLACVATSSPAVDWLDTDLVITADEPQQFADAVVAAALTKSFPVDVERRRELASRHTWSARARELLRLAGQTAAPNDNPTGSEDATVAASAAPHGGTG